MPLNSAKCAPPDVRSLYIAEPGSPDLDLAVAFPGGLSDLASNVLTLPITIGPDNEHCGASRLLLNILGDVLLVLGFRCHSAPRPLRLNEDGRTYIWDGCYDAGVEEGFRRWMLPVFEVWRELGCGEMAPDSRHGHLGGAPWRAEVEVKGIVFGVSIPGVALTPMSAFCTVYIEDFAALIQSESDPQRGDRRLPWRWKASRQRRERGSYRRRRRRPKKTRVNVQETGNSPGQDISEI